MKVSTTVKNAVKVSRATHVATGVGAVLLGAAVVVSAQGQSQNQSQADQVRARQRVALMESVFERAVANGADNLVRQVRAVLPDPPMFLGAPKARGFRLDGYGVFFDVEVPGLRPPVTWTLRYMLDDSRRAAAALSELRSFLGQLGPRERARGQEMVSRLEAQMGAARATRVGGQGSGAELAGLGATPDVDVPPDARPVLDPSEAYTNEVKASLVDAMLENSGTLALGPDEWLTVAARDNVPSDPLVPSDKSDFSTLMFTIKGSDLAAFRAGRLTLEQARARVTRREY